MTPITLLAQIIETSLMKNKRSETEECEVNKTHFNELCATLESIALIE